MDLRLQSSATRRIGEVQIRGLSRLVAALTGADSARSRPQLFQVQDLLKRPVPKQASKLLLPFRPARLGMWLLKSHFVDAADVLRRRPSPRADVLVPFVPFVPCYQEEEAAEAGTRRIVPQARCRELTTS